MVFTCFKCLKPGKKMKQLGFKPFRSFTENMGLTDIAQKPRVLSDHGQNKAQGKTQRGGHNCHCPLSNKTIHQQPKRPDILP